MKVTKKNRLHDKYPCVTFNDSTLYLQATSWEDLHVHCCATVPNPSYPNVFPKTNLNTVLGYDFQCFSDDKCSWDKWQTVRKNRVYFKRICQGR